MRWRALTHRQRRETLRPQLQLAARALRRSPPPSIGIVCIDSAGLHDPNSSPAKRAVKLFYVVLGIGVMIGVSFVDYRNWQRWAPGLYVVESAVAALHFARRPQRARGAALGLARTVRHVSTVRAGETHRSRSRWPQCCAAELRAICKISGSRCWSVGDPGAA